jgi:hypothetical protein
MSSQIEDEYKLFSEYWKNYELPPPTTLSEFDLLSWLHSKERAEWMARGLVRRLPDVPTVKAVAEAMGKAIFAPGTFGNPTPRAKTLAEMTDDERKGLPIFSGVVDYFPDALLEVAAVSKTGNDQHNPGEPLHWAKHKSQDHLNTAMRHEMQHGTKDKDGRRHLGKAAWRILAALQIEIEAERANMTVKEYNEHLREIAAEKKK